MYRLESTSAACASMRSSSDDGHGNSAMHFTWAVSSRLFQSVTFAFLCHVWLTNLAQLFRSTLRSWQCSRRWMLGSPWPWPALLMLPRYALHGHISIQKENLLGRTCDNNLLSGASLRTDASGPTNHSNACSNYSL